MERNPEEGLNEDEDVQMEKARVKEALTCQSCEEVSENLLELLNCVSVDDREPEFAGFLFIHSMFFTHHKLI